MFTPCLASRGVEELVNEPQRRGCVYPRSVRNSSPWKKARMGWVDRVEGLFSLSLSLPLFLHSSYSVNRELARIQSKLLGQTLGHLIPDKGRRLLRPAVAPAKPLGKISLRSLPALRASCLLWGVWRSVNDPLPLPDDSRIRGMNGVDESIRFLQIDRSIFP